MRSIAALQDLHDRFALVYEVSGTVFDAQEHVLVPLDSMRNLCTSRQLHRNWMESLDKRVVRIHLTAKGKQMRDVSRNTVIKFNEAVQSRFTPEQMNNFRQVMLELDRILEQEQLF